MSGATSATLTVTNVQADDAGTYQVIVTNVAGSVTSALTTLTVNAPALPPSITPPPRNPCRSWAACRQFTTALACRTRGFGNGWGIP